MEKTRLSVYSLAVSENFSFLKQAVNIQEAYLRAIPVAGGGCLLPVCEMHKRDATLLRLLTEWRNRNVAAYPNQFTASEESTRDWLDQELLAVKDRMLFLVVSPTGQTLGHLGFSGCHNSDMMFEIDNVVRGVADAGPDIFARAMTALIEWARKTINVNGFFLRAMNDDHDAIAFYKKNHFVAESSIPLVAVKDGDGVNYREALPTETASKHFMRMVYKAPAHEVGEKLILTAGPSISAKEAVYAFDAALSGWNGNWSRYLSRFEKSFAEYVGVKHALATSSCTGALQIALMALDIAPGDEVIVPDQTWVATANAVRYVGAIPVFADIELDTWNIDARSVETLITGKTKAIVAVHMYGHPARMSNILAVARQYGLKVVEDAAPAIGAEWQGKRCGSFGDFAAFSFQGAKLMVTGEGGMLVTNDDDLYAKAYKIWDQGRNPSRTFWIDEDGVKFKMSNIQAALGLGQLERVDELIEMKRRIFEWYQEGLEGVPHISLNQEVEGARSIYWMSSILLDKDARIGRDALMQQLKTRNIDSRPVFPAISQYPIWPREQPPQSTAMHVGLQAINLPSGVCLSRDEVAYACKHIRSILLG
ncbi:GNAT family N-acetyltransferase [Chromobacterium sphagni]|uniref:GNAT family N-acetyltransferase n=1 Tax=Chromobacterium sphagni TaxID=1903179 RepID=A0A1S1X339_9NEIS|nr:aminotransferase class I/II-fold pyridoxal phosphate-dependent enzyme [Chromobacterium sphagni]OHX13830.1 GNAT family N-acetyltransferase [Chromobacterium sphagni]